MTEQGENIVLRLRYRAPFDWENLLAFLDARAIAGVEVVEDGRYFRVIEIDGALGSIAVKNLPERQSLEVAILFPHVKALPAIVGRVRRLFDLGADIAKIEQDLSRDYDLARLIRGRPGLRAPGGWDGFEVAVRAVLGQQVSVAAARRLAGRLVEMYGRTVPKLFRIHPALVRAFPDAKRLAAAASIRLPMPGARHVALKAVAEAATANPGLFHPRDGVDSTVERLKAIRGVGEWTAQYIALRAVREPDAFPATDLGLLRGAAFINGGKVSATDLCKRAESWRPWRAYAAQHLWAAGSRSAVIEERSAA